MITEQDLQEAIAECEGQRNPNANTCIKLAAFYTIKEHLFGNAGNEEKIPQMYSYAAESNGDEYAVIDYGGDTEFLQEVYGMSIDDCMPIMDELMTALQVIQPRLYDGVIRKLQEKK